MRETMIDVFSVRILYSWKCVYNWASLYAFYENRRYFNSHAGGMAVARPNGFEIDFVRNPISGSASKFFVFILKFIFTLIFEIKIFEKKFLFTKIISLKLRYLLELLFLYKKKMNTSEEKLKNTKSLQIRFVIVSPISQDI